MKQVIIFSIMLGLCGCCRKIVPSITEKVVYRDSIREVLRDTTIYVAIEKTVNSRVALTTDTSVLTNRFAISTAFVRDGLLFHNLEQKQQDLPFEIKYVDRFRYVSRDSVVRETQLMKVEKALTKWQELTMLLGKVFGMLLMFGLFVIVYKIYRR